MTQSIKLPETHGERMTLMRRLLSELGTKRILDAGQEGLTKAELMGVFREAVDDAIADLPQVYVTKVEPQRGGPVRWLGGFVDTDIWKKKRVYGGG